VARLDLPAIMERLCLSWVIIDEAPNARTRLSFDTLARFQPSCIVEFTSGYGRRDPIAIATG
jgi:hypothetical protein